MKANPSRSIRSFIFAFLLLIVPASLPAADEPVTLERAVELAVANNERSIAAEAQFQAAEARVRKARAFFFPDVTLASNYTRRLLRIQTAVGSNLAETDRYFRRAEDFLLSRPEVDRVFGSVGGMGGGGVNSGMMFVTLKPPKERTLSQQEFAGVVHKELNSYPGLKAITQDMSQSGFTASRGFPVEFSVIGIAKKNSIILVDYASQNQRDGMNAHDAMLKAGPIRLRPILMTSVATLMAAIPPALALGPGSETRGPMAFAIIAGLVVSMLLSLIVVPAFYVVADDTKGWIARRFAKNEGGEAAPETSGDAVEAG